MEERGVICVIETDTRIRDGIRGALEQAGRKCQVFATWGVVLDDMASTKGARYCAITTNIGENPDETLRFVALMRQIPGYGSVSVVLYTNHTFESLSDAGVEEVEGMVHVEKDLPTHAALIEELVRIAMDANLSSERV